MPGGRGRKRITAPNGTSGGVRERHGGATPHGEAVRGVPLILGRRRFHRPSDCARSSGREVVAAFPSLADRARNADGTTSGDGASPRGRIAGQAWFKPG